MQYVLWTCCVGFDCGTAGPLQFSWGSGDKIYSVVSSHCRSVLWFSGLLGPFLYYPDVYYKMSMGCAFLSSWEGVLFLELDQTFEPVNGASKTVQALLGEAHLGPVHQVAALGIAHEYD